MSANRLQSLAAFCASVVTLASIGTPAIAEVTFNSRPDEALITRLPVYLWQDTAQDPRAVVLLIHGISQRAGTLQELAGQLASNGCLTYGFDLRGHGWWHYDCQPGSIGYRCDYKSSAGDVEQIVSLLKKEHPQLPIFVVGESVGAAVALRAAAQQGNTVNGLVLCGSGFKTGRVSPAWIAEDLIKHCLRPTKEISIVRYQRRYGTDDLSALNETIEDPKQRKTFTFGEILKVTRFISANRKYAKKLSPQTSVYVVQGSQDRTLTTKSAQQVFAAVPGADKKIFVVPGCGHILLGTNHMKPAVKGSITSFITERAAQQQFVAAPGAVPQ